MERIRLVDRPVLLGEAFVWLFWVACVSSAVSGLVVGRIGYAAGYVEAKREPKDIWSYLMSAGFFDYLRMSLGGWLSPPNASVILCGGITIQPLLSGTATIQSRLDGTATIQPLLDGDASIDSDC